MALIFCYSVLNKGFKLLLAFKLAEDYLAARPVVHFNTKVKGAVYKGS